MTPNRGASPELSAHRFKIAVEVRHDAEPERSAKRLQDWAIAGENGATCRPGNPQRDALAASAVDLASARSAATSRQFASSFGGQRVDRLLEAGRGRERADERVIGGIESRRESFGGKSRPSV